MQHTSDRRPTIGILPGWLGFEGSTPDRYLNSVYSGIREQAKARGCNILLAWGGGRVVEISRVYPAWPVVGPDSDFVPVGPWNTDGLIVLAPLLNKKRSAYIQKIIAKGHPVLFVASGETGPSICFDNQVGILQAMGHLASHGHRRVAFIAGEPDDRGDGAERYAAYRTALKEFNLEDDPALVAYGRHSMHGGRAAMQALLAAGTGFSAVQASNDLSAIGAMQVLRAAGLRIPRDVAIIGFDDQPDAAAQVPSLSTIKVPLVESGARALDYMCDFIEKGIPLESILIPTRLVRRQSCGCLPERLFSSAPGVDISGIPLRSLPPESLDASAMEDFKSRMVTDMLAAMPAEADEKQKPMLRRLCFNLVEAFLNSIAAEDTRQFTTLLLDSLQELELADGDVDSFQGAISALRRNIVDQPGLWPILLDRRHLVEDIFHQARITFSESLRRADLRHQVTLEASAYRLSVLTSRLSASLNNHQTIKILLDNLSEVSIHQATVLLFKSSHRDPVALSQVIHPDPDFKAPFMQFRTRSFPPVGLYPADEPLSLALVPLVFQNEPLGYVAFDAKDLNTIAVIALQLAANLKAARLHTEVVELSILDGLTGIYNRRFLELFLNKEVERCRRYQRGLSVIMLDIDHFKKYNDTYGHPAGDIILQKVAKLLQEHGRRLDIVARFGGDEFALILPETDQSGAAHLAEAIRARVEALFAADKGITISLGVASMYPGHDGSEELIQTADLALYEAKRGGKNRVCTL